MRLPEQAPNFMSLRNILGIGLAVSSIALSGCGDDKKTPEARWGYDSVGTPYDCTYSNDSPQPLVDDSPPKIRVWGRCQDEVHDPAGVYPDASFDQESVAKVTNNRVVEIICVKKGEYTQDSRGPKSGSTTWVRIKDRRSERTVTGYMAEPNLGFVEDEAYERC